MNFFSLFFLIVCAEAVFTEDNCKDLMAGKLCLKYHKRNFSSCKRTSTVVVSQNVACLAHTEQCMKLFGTCISVFQSVPQVHEVERIKTTATTPTTTTTVTTPTTTTTTTTTTPTTTTTTTTTATTTTTLTTTTSAFGRFLLDRIQEESPHLVQLETEILTEVK